MKSKNKKILISGILLSLFTISFIVSYAFFNYSKDTNELVIKTGDIYMKLDSGSDNISLDYMFPETRKEALARTDNFIDFTVSGINGYSKKIYYKIDVLNGDLPSSYTEDNRIDPENIKLELVDMDNDQVIITESYQDVINNGGMYIGTLGKDIYKLKDNYDVDTCVVTLKEMWNYSDDYTVGLANLRDYCDGTGSYFYYVELSEWDLSHIGYLQMLIDGGFTYSYVSVDGDGKILTDETSVNTCVTGFTNDYGTNSMWDTFCNGTTDAGIYSHFTITDYLNGNVPYFTASQDEIDYLLDIDYISGTTSNYVVDTSKLDECIDYYINNGSDISYNYYFNYGGTPVYTFCNNQDFILLGNNFYSFDTDYKYGYFDEEGKETLNNNGLLEQDYDKKINILEEHHFRLRVWIDEDTLISDTDSNKDYCASSYCNDSTKQIYKDLFASIKINVYGDFNEKYLYNVMGTLSSFSSYKESIKEVYFLNEEQSLIDASYEAATIKFDITNTSKTVGTNILQTMDSYGKVLAWLEAIDETYYKLYIASDGYTYLSTGYSLFEEFTNLNTIDLSNVRTNYVTNMRFMFQECSNLISLDLGMFNTSNVTDMYSLFGYSSNLTTLDLSSFDTSNVTTMYGMFAKSSSLICLNVSKFNTSKVTNMGLMFQFCSSLISLDLSNFNTSNVSTMSNMFSNCSSLTNLDVSNFDTSNVTSMSGMFYKCSKITSLDVSNFNTSNVKTMYKMFYECSSLTTLDLSNFDTSKVKVMSYMFYGCTSLTNLNLSSFNTSNVTDIQQMFYNCSSLTNLDLSSFDTSNVTDMLYMFYSCSSLISLDVSNFDTSKVTNMCCMFYHCSSLTSLDLTNFNTSKVTTMSHMYFYCSNLTSLNLSNFDTSSVTNMSGMFNGCSSLISLDVSNFDTSKVTDMSYMFDTCSNLTSLDLGKFNTSKVNTMFSMFCGCSSLTTLDLSKFDTSNVTTMSCMFCGCSSLTSLDVSSFNTSNVTNMMIMFSNCCLLTNLNVSSFNTSNVTNMASMFSNCKSLTSLDISSFNTKKVTFIYCMFQTCSNLTTIYVGNDWSVAAVTGLKDMFGECTNLVGGNGTTFNASYTDATYARVDTSTTPGYLTLKA